MKKVLLAVFCLVLCITTRSYAQGKSPYSEVKGKTVISEFHTLNKPSTTEGIFVNALLWMIEHKDKSLEDTHTKNENKKLFEVDYDKKQLLAEVTLTNPKTDSFYRYLYSAKITDNIITILASDISFEAQSNVIKFVKRLTFEKLQPEKKPKHKEYLDEFAKLHRIKVDEMLEAITQNPAPPITHWDKIKENDVVKGMNKAECLMSFGKPASIQKQGNKEEWMYDSYTYLFFENGIVQSLIK